MKHLSFTMPDNFNLFCFGDDQYGSRFHYPQGVEYLLKTFNKSYAGCSNNYGWHHGDAVEAITSVDYRWSREQNLIDELDDQIDYTIDKYKSMGKRLLGMNDGNHERASHRTTNMNKRICKGLGIPSGTYQTKISYLDKEGKLIFKHFATHGFKSINSSLPDERERRFSMERTLRRLMNRKAEDCILKTMGHTHKLLSVKPIRRLMLISDGDEEIAIHANDVQHPDIVLDDNCWYGNTGSFMRIHVEDYTGYAEIAGYDPIEMGFLIVKVRDRVIVGIDEIALGC